MKLCSTMQLFLFNVNLFLHSQHETWCKTLADDVFFCVECEFVC